MPQPHSPTVRGRKLAAELRRIREATGLTLEEAAAQLGQDWTRHRLAYIERAKTKPTAQAVEAALDLYGVDNATRAALIDLHKNSWRRGWWTEYSDVFRGAYVEMEDDAERIDAWCPQVVPGLLQTDEYALELIHRWTNDDAAAQRRLQARATRRALLARVDPPAPILTAILDEAVLRRPIGGPDVMRGQLNALIDAGRRPNVTVCVVPFEAGTHAGLDGPFIILGFPEAIAPDVAYSEVKAGDAYAENTQEVRRITLDFRSLKDAALSPEDSAEFIAAVAQGGQSHE